ncbi:hypothetical protein [Maribacter sp. 2307ULW6-5]|uniref:hypothetical protein n=1 Tax=Maribacter sp. 2307ULW6-5 TaxID=3386275 RepID=UPI0039BC2996
MNKTEELKRFALMLLLAAFIGAGALTSCREQKKAEQTEQQEVAPEAEEHPSSDGEAKDEHPTGGDEHPSGEEHPSNGGDEHPN